MTDAWSAMGYGEPDEPSALILKTQSLRDVETPDVERVTSGRALPVFAGMFTGLVGPSEVGKTTLAAHAVLDVAARGHRVLICDGEMTAAAWRRKLVCLGADDDALRRAHYLEMSESAAHIERMRVTVASLDARLVVWDSALSLISRTARSENDNAEVGRVFDRLRAILKDSAAAGLVVDHSAAGSASPVSRGASAKFAALDISYGVRLADGSIPGPLDTWSSIISVEKDRHGLLGNRSDREATFCPLGGRMMQVDIVETFSASHRLSLTNPVAVAVDRLAALDPPPKSANDAFKRIGGSRATVLIAYKKWSDQTGTSGTPYRARTTSTTGTGGTEPVPNRSTTQEALEAGESR